MESELEFSYVWDGRHIGLNFPEIWERIRLVTSKPREKILEVGCFEGFSTSKMIEIFATHHPIAMTCIDTWNGAIFHNEQVQPDHEARFHRNVGIASRAAPHPVSMRILKSDSYLALSSLIHHGEGETFDWIYLDGSHESADVLCDAVAAFKLLKPDGILVFDDYLWTEPLARGGHVNNTPKPAIDAFVNIYFERLNVISGGGLSQLYIRKL